MSALNETSEPVEARTDDALRRAQGTSELPDASPTGHAPRAERQAINYCPYCSEENLFPLEGGGWECRSCRRAFAVTFKGLVAPAHRGGPL